MEENNILAFNGEDPAEKLAEKLVGLGVDLDHTSLALAMREVLFGLLYPEKKDRILAQLTESGLLDTKSNLPYALQYALLEENLLRSYRRWIPYLAESTISILEDR